MTMLRNDMLSILMSSLFAQCVFVTVKLKIADYPGDGAKASAELAKLTKTNEDALYHKRSDPF